MIQTNRKKKKFNQALDEWVYLRCCLKIHCKVECMSEINKNLNKWLDLNNFQRNVDEKGFFAASFSALHSRRLSSTNGTIEMSYNVVSIESFSWNYYCASFVTGFIHSNEIEKWNNNKNAFKSNKNEIHDLSLIRFNNVLYTQTLFWHPSIYWSGIVASWRSLAHSSIL